MIRRTRQRVRRRNAAAVCGVGLGALALGAACTTKGEGLILVELSSSQPVDHARVFVAAPADQSVLGMATADWPAAPPLRLGVYVPKGVSGSVDVIACGFDANGNLVAATPDDPASFTAVAQPGGQSAIVTIGLAAGSAPLLCGTVGAGGHGGGGAGGTSGSGGSGGSGGSTGGTGGSAGGTSGNGSGGTGGTAGSGARGGTGGTGGAAGTGGTGGTGTGGTGAGGTGGTGGSAPTWQGAVAAANVAASSQTLPSVAVDKNGNAVVVYVQDTQIWATRYDFAGKSWGTPGPIDSRASAQSKPAVGVDKNGNYLAIWNLQSNSPVQGVWQSTSANGTVWTTPTSITQTTAISPALSVNANGAAVVAWDEVLTNGERQAVASVRPAPGQPWATPQVMRAADDTGDRNVVVAMAGNGNAFVGWEQTDGVTYYNSVWMRQYTAGAGWNAAALFESYTDNGTGDIGIAANTGGDAIVTYLQVSNTNPATIQLWARRYSQLSMSFATNPSKVYEATSIDSVVSPSVTLDDAGNATVAFAVQTGTGYEVQTSRTAPTDPAWPAVPTAMETDDVAKNNDPNSTLGYVTMPVVAADPAGNVTLVWRKRTSASGTRFDLVSRRYAAGAWGPQVSLETNPTNSVFWPALAVGANGAAVTVWYFANTLDVWANVFR